MAEAHDNKSLIDCHIQEVQEEHLELLLLTAHASRTLIQSAIHKPGATDQAHWMAKTIYDLKNHLLCDRCESVMKEPAKVDLFVVHVYIKSGSIILNAVVNDIALPIIWW